MGELKIFPRNVSERIKIESAVRQELKKSGFPIEMENEILQHMEYFFDLICIEFSFPVDEFWSEHQKMIADKLREFTNNLLLDRIRLEIEIYTLRH